MLTYTTTQKIYYPRQNMIQLNGFNGFSYKELSKYLGLILQKLSPKDTGKIFDYNGGEILL